MKIGKMTYGKYVVPKHDDQPLMILNIGDVVYSPHKDGGVMVITKLDRARNIGQFIYFRSIEEARAFFK